MIFGVRVPSRGLHHNTQIRTRWARILLINKCKDCTCAFDDNIFCKYGFIIAVKIISGNKLTVKSTICSLDFFIYLYFLLFWLWVQAYSLLFNRNSYFTVGNYCESQSFGVFIPFGFQFCIICARSCD